MATATSSFLMDNSSDANFRAWGSWISTELAAMGWVQTADTGQINWTTVTHPTLTNAAQGYEIWRMADTLQATAPVFIKLEYGSGGVAAVQPGVWITVGTASNGAGTLTGATTLRQALPTNTNNTSAALPCYISGDTNRLQLAMFTNTMAVLGIAAMQGILITIERTKDSTGADTNTGVTFAGCGYNAGLKSYQQTLPTTGGGGPPTQNVSTLAIAPSPATAAYGTSIGVSPIWPMLGQYLNPLVGLMSVCVADVTPLATTSLSPYGTAHTYLALGGGASNQAFTPSSAALGTTTFLMRYD